MTHYPRIRRFPRSPSDAFLAPPPDTRVYCAEVEIDGLHHPCGMVGAVREILRSEYPFIGDGDVQKIDDLVKYLVQSGAAEKVEWVDRGGGFHQHASLRITRRVVISKKVRDNLTPLQRQRMHKPSKL